MANNSNHRLQLGESVCTGALRVVDALLQDATGFLECPGGNRAEDIHAVRTAIKKARAILRLIRPAIGETTFRWENSELGKTARLLSPMRDAAVGVQTLRHLGRRTRRPRKIRDLSIVQAEFARQHAASVPIQKRSMLATLRALKASRQRIQKLRLAVQASPAKDLGLKNVYRASRRRMHEAFASGDDGSFHRWRIRLKNLYYGLQFLTPIWPSRLRPMVARIKKVQQIVGDDHDLAVLKSCLQAAPERFGGRKAVKGVLRQLKRRSKNLREICQPLGDEVLQEKPSCFARRLELRLESFSAGGLPSRGAVHRLPNCRGDDAHTHERRKA